MCDHEINDQELAEIRGWLAKAEQAVGQPIGDLVCSKCGADVHVADPKEWEQGDWCDSCNQGFVDEARGMMAKLLHKIDCLQGHRPLSSPKVTMDCQNEHPPESVEASMGTIRAALGFVAGQFMDTGALMCHHAGYASAALQDGDPRRSMIALQAAAERLDALRKRVDEISDALEKKLPNLVLASDVRRISDAFGNAATLGETLASEG